MVVVTLFVICWLPYHGFFVWSEPNYKFSTWFNHFYLTTQYQEYRTMVITCTRVIERVHERQDNNTSPVNLLFYRLLRFRAGGLPRSLFTLGIRNIPIHQWPSRLIQAHTAHLPVVLLAGDEQYYDQSSRLLLHEHQVIERPDSETDAKVPLLRLWLFVLIFGLRFREHFRTVLCCWKRPLSTSATSPMRGALVMRQLRNDRADFVPGQSLLLVTLDPFSTSTST